MRLLPALGLLLLTACASGGESGSSTSSSTGAASTGSSSTGSSSGSSGGAGCRGTHAECSTLAVGGCGHGCSSLSDGGCGGVPHACATLGIDSREACSFHAGCSP